MTALRIKELCKEKGVTLNALCEKIGISQPSMSLIANGKQKPSFDTLEKISEALGVGVGELFAPADGVRIICPHCGKQITLFYGERE